MRPQRVPSAAQWVREAEVDLPSGDRFAVKDIAKRLVELLSEVAPPFTASLSGSWGVGKSTVAKAVIKGLEADGVRAVLIDAWTTDISDLRRSLVLEVGAALTAPGSNGKVPLEVLQASRKDIADELDEARETRTDQQAARLELRDWKDLKALLQQRALLLAVADLVAWGSFFAVLAGPDSGLQPVFASMVAAVLTLAVTGSLFKVVTPSVTRLPHADAVLLSQAFERLVKGQSKHANAEYSKPVIVVLDNLDRVSGDDALDALAQIRSFVDIDGSRCIFLIPIDRRRLAEHLAIRLASTGAAGDYLEKFFNTDIELVKPEQVDLFKWTREESDRLFAEVDEAERRTASEVIVVAAGGSPRAVVRMLNGLVTRYRMTRPLRPRVPLDSLALVEGLVSLVPTLADTLAVTPRVLTDARAMLVEPSAADPTRGLDEMLADASERDDHDSSALHKRVRDFLLAASDIALDAQQLHVSLALRTERLWGDIEDADAVSAAVMSGDSEALDRAFEGRPEPEKRLLLERSLWSSPSWWCNSGSASSSRRTLISWR